MGVAASANLATRYAAADLAPEAKRASTIGLMVWASTFGAGFGSLISLSFLDPAGVRIGLPNYAGSYLAGFVLLLAAGVIVEVRLRPDPLVIAGGVGTAIQHAMSFATFTRLIWENVGARVAVLAMMVSQATMVGTMTLTPLHMKHGGHTGAAIGVMLFGHMMGMYLFSPLVGKMTDRLGSYPMLLVAGVFCVFGALSAGLTPEGGFIGLVVGQAAIGLAWCFGVVAASGLLTDSVPVEKRASVQGMGDLCMSAFGALAGISAGAIVATRSYLDLNLAATALGTVLVGVVLQAVFFSGGRQVAPSRVG
jgi:MFS family permease